MVIGQHVLALNIDIGTGTTGYSVRLLPANGYIAILRAIIAGYWHRLRTGWLRLDNWQIPDRL